MTFKILTDSTADLDETWAKEHDVEIVGLSIQIDGTHYETVGPDKLTSPQLLAEMQKGAKPTTSQVNVGQFQEIFKGYAQRKENLLYIAFSSVLSGTYQSAVMARDLVLEDYPEAVIEIIDPKAAGIGEGYLSMLAVEARDTGKSLDQVKEELLEIAPKLRTYFLVEGCIELCCQAFNVVIGGLLLCSEDHLDLKFFIGLANPWHVLGIKDTNHANAFKASIVT